MFWHVEKEHRAELTNNLRTVNPCLAQGFQQHIKVLQSSLVVATQRLHTNNGRKVIIEEKRHVCDNVFKQSSDSVNLSSSKLNETKPFPPWRFTPAQLRMMHELRTTVSTKRNTQVLHLKILTFSSANM